MHGFILNYSQRATLGATLCASVLPLSTSDTFCTFNQKHRLRDGTHEQSGTVLSGEAFPWGDGRAGVSLSAGFERHCFEVLSVPGFFVIKGRKL